MLYVELSNNEIPGSVSEHFQIRSRIFGKKVLSIVFLLPSLICLKETLYFNGQSYGTLLKQNLKIKKVSPALRVYFKRHLEIINHIKHFFLHLTQFHKNWQNFAMLQLLL